MDRDDTPETIGDKKSAERTERPQHEFDDWVPLCIREARRAPKEVDDLWPYVWMNFVSVILLFSALAIACYRVGAQSCH
jgi:hypothetical protein